MPDQSSAARDFPERGIKHRGRGARALRGRKPGVPPVAIDLTERLGRGSAASQAADARRRTPSDNRRNVARSADNNAAPRLIFGQRAAVNECGTVCQTGSVAARKARRYCIAASPGGGVLDNATYDGPVLPLIAHSGGAGGHVIRRAAGTADRQRTARGGIGRGEIGGV